MVYFIEIIAVEKNYILLVCNMTLLLLSCVTQRGELLTSLCLIFVICTMGHNLLPIGSGFTGEQKK